jgi:hypothetical protein
MSIPVICDRCRSTGIAGEADFSHLGDLLDFEPVPRKKERVDGWTAERQRAFIAAVSATGSKRRAALAIGMAVFGVDQLLKAEGNEGFVAAFDKAMLIAKANGSMKIAQGVADAAARNAQLTPPSRLRGYQPESEPEIGDDHKWELIRSIGVKFMRKVAAERQARLDGEIVAADFYLRQITFMEVMLDLLSTDFGFDAQEVLRELRRGNHGLLEIAATWLSDRLDHARREWWRQEGQPERPPYPDPRFLERHRSAEGDYAIQIEQHAYGATTRPARGHTAEEWSAMNNDEQAAARQRQLAEDAAEQGAWEARARAEFDAFSSSRN